MINIYILILNWNGKKDTLECLDSVSKIQYSNYRVVVIDNGSTDDSVEAISEAFPHVTILKTGKNLGFAGGNNIGIDYALKEGADAVLLLNNDTVVDPDLLSAFAQNGADVQGAKIYLYDDRNRLDHLGGVWNSKKAAFDFIGHRALDEGQCDKSEVDYLCGCALFIRRAVVETIGGLEPSFFLIWEEADFCMRARRLGFTLSICPEAKVWHKVSASFSGGKAHSTYFWWRGRLLWIKRNCSKEEKRRIFFRLAGEIGHIAKLYLIKSLFSRNDRHLPLYQASLAGVRDYFLKRFDEGPSWIRTKHFD